MTDVQILSLICIIIGNHEKFKKACFMKGFDTYKERKAFNEKYTVPYTEFDYNGHRYSVQYDVKAYNTGIYVKGTYTKDGKKTTLTAIKNIYKQLIAKGVLIID